MKYAILVIALILIAGVGLKFAVSKDANLANKPSEKTHDNTSTPVTASSRSPSQISSEVTAPSESPKTKNEMILEAQKKADELVAAQLHAAQLAATNSDNGKELKSNVEAERQSRHAEEKAAARKAADEAIAASQQSEQAAREKQAANDAAEAKKKVEEEAAAAIRRLTDAGEKGQSTE